MRFVVSALILGLTAGRAWADDTIVALSPTARAAAIESAANRDDALPLNGDPRKIHGEIGMEIGTGGYRALYGTTVIPIGQTGSAAFSFLTSQANGWRR